MFMVNKNYQCSDLKCVQKPTRGRLSLTHLPVQPLSPCNQSGRKGKGLWRKGFAEEPSLEFRILIHLNDEYSVKSKSKRFV